MKCQNNRESAWRAMTKFVLQLGRYEPSSPSTMIAPWVLSEARLVPPNFDRCQFTGHTVEHLTCVHSDQSYKHFTLIFDPSTVAVTIKIQISFWVINYERKVFIRLTTAVVEFSLLIIDTHPRLCLGEGWVLKICCIVTQLRVAINEIL